MSQQRKSRRWLRRVALGLGAFAIVAFVAAVIVARIWFHGERLGAFVEQRINEKIRGRVSIGSIEWPLLDATSIVTGGWMDLTVHDIEVYDANGELVLETPMAEGRIRLRRFAFDRDYFFDRIRLPEGGRALLYEEPEPYPENPTETDVVTLISTFYPKQTPPPPGDPIWREPFATWSLTNLDIDDVELTFRFGDTTTTVHVEQSEGRLYYAKPYGWKRDVGKFAFELKNVTIDDGTIEHPGIEPIGLHSGTIERLAKRNPDKEWELDRHRSLKAEGVAITTDEGAHIELERAEMNDYWLNVDGGTYDVLAVATNAGALAERLTDDTVGGEKLRVEIAVTGPRREPDLAVSVFDLVTSIEPAPDQPQLDLYVAEGHAEYHGATGKGALRDTVALGADGEIHAAASFDATDQSFTADIDIPEPLQLAPWLDREIARLTGGTRLRGGLHVRSIDDGVRVEKLGLSLGDTRFTGALEYSSDRELRTDDFRVTRGETHVHSHRGTIDLAERTLDLGVTFASNNLRPWLRRFRKPEVAKRASGSARITGSLDDPIVPRAKLTLRGIPVIDRADSTLSYRGGVLSIERAESTPFGGALSANGKLRLTGREPRILDLRIGGGGFDLARAPSFGPALAGTADIHLSAEGALSAPKSTFGADVQDLRIAGDAYTGFLLSGGTDPDGSATLQFHVDRRAGGRLDLNGTIGPYGDIGGVVSAREIPLHSLPGVLDEDGESVFGGVADAELQLAGTLDAPSADGYLTVTRGWFKQAFLGAADLSIEVVGPGQMRVAGSMFQGKFQLDGTLQTAPTLSANLDIGFRRIELDQFFPELAAEYGLRGWMSGNFVGLRLEPGKRPTFTLHLTELVVLMDNEDQRGRPRPIKARAINDVIVSYDGVSARLVQPAVFRGPTGEFTLTGHFDPEAVDAHLAGTVDVALLQPYLRDVFESASGSVKASVDLSGPPADIRVLGVLDINSIELRPLGQDAEIRIPTAKLQITNDAISFTGFSIDMYDEITEETDQLEVKGSVQLDDFKPSKWGLLVDGTLAGKLLMVLAPDAFTAASGHAEVFFALGGTGYMPDIEGTITFGERTPLTFSPRGLRREILLNGGEINFEDQEIEIVGLRGTIDNSGTLADLSGEMSLEDWAPASVDVTLSAFSLPFRIPRVLELELDVPSLRVVGDTDGLDVFGDLDIIDGRYIQKFNPLLNALKPERVRETETPFYKEIDLIARSKLDLRVTTGGGFGIKNNIANIDLDGEVLVTGTPVRPVLDGEIQVKQGSFKFQGMRTEFERTEGSIVFSRFRRFPEDNPTIDIRSEADYLDTRGTTHEVVLELTGTLSNLNWDLYTRNTNLGKAQTFTLLFSGRTTEENRALLGDQAVAPTSAFEGNRSTADTESAVGAFDQLAKDFLGDFISVLVEQPLRSATGLDVFRIEVGTAGFGVRVEERVSNDSRAIAEYDRTLNGQTFSARAEHRVFDELSLEAEYLIKQFFEDTDDDENAFRAKAVWRDRVGD